MHLFIPRRQLLCDYVNNSICFEYMNCGGERRRGRREAKENSPKLRREKTEMNEVFFFFYQGLYFYFLLLSRLILTDPSLPGD